MEELVKNCCDGGLLIAENFHLRKKELDKQSMNCVASQNNCFLKMSDQNTPIEQSL